MKIVTWIKNNQNNDWFDLLRLNLDAPYFYGKRGVYVIWYTSPAAAKVIRVGSGNIAERLKAHRANNEIIRYSAYGQLKVAWIIVDNVTVFEKEILGIEAYLAKAYSPLVGDNFPNALLVPVNLIGK